MKNSQLIKRNKIAGGYTKVYPLAYIQGITNGATGEALTSILQSFNHIYLPFLGTAEDTRMSLPFDYRRQGIFITYKSDKGLVTEFYKGTVEDLNNDILFVEDINWEVIPNLEYVRNNASKIPNGAILPDHLSPTLWELLGSNNTITNLPDEDDLTQNYMVLSFKDRKYDPEGSGLGYKILRKNWVSGENILTADMVSSDHTIYEVRYNFNLKGAAIKLPDKCTLLFKGGSFNNGVITCNNTNIIGINKFEDGGTAKYTGTFDKGLVMVINGTVMWYDGTRWKKIETDNVASNYTARVVQVNQSTQASAEATMVGNEIQFKFGLPKVEKGQIIYPAGIYNNDTVYITDENKAPYVLDTTDNNFYVLNAQMSWKGSEQDNKTPSQDYTINKGKYWLKFDAFEAVYTKIGIIANGLIGSAVFNGDYMFSQQGINPSSSNAITTHYENFDKDHIYDGTFTPNIMFDFKTGAGHLAAGKIKFDASGGVVLNDLKVKGTIRESYQIISSTLSPSPEYNNYILGSDCPNTITLNGTNIFKDTSNEPIKFTIINKSGKTVRIDTYNLEGSNLHFACACIYLDKDRVLECIAIPTGYAKDAETVIVNLTEFSYRNWTASEDCPGDESMYIYTSEKQAFKAKV